MRSTGIIYAVFKSAGKTRWKNLGADDVRQARELLGEEIQREAKVDWKRARTINLRGCIQSKAERLGWYGEFSWTNVVLSNGTASKLS